MEWFEGLPADEGYYWHVSDYEPRPEVVYFYPRKLLSDSVAGGVYGGLYYERMGTDVNAPLYWAGEKEHHWLGPLAVPTPPRLLEYKPTRKQWNE